MAHSIKGRYFLPQSSRSHAASLTEHGAEITIAPEHGREFKSVRTEIKSIQGRRDVYCASGGYFRADDDLPRGFAAAQTPRMTRIINAITGFSPVRAVIMVAALIGAVLTVRVVFSVFVAWSVTAFPHEWERAIGSLAWTEINAIYEMQPSALPPARIASLTGEAGAMATAAGFTPVPEIHFRNVPGIGANAFALPGGPVMLTDDLVNLMDDEEVLAVIAHEFAHVEKRHALRQTIDTAGTLVFFWFVFGSEEILIDVLAESAALLLGLHLSREDEFEADARAAEMMLAVMRDPLAIAGGLDKLRRAFCDTDGQLTLEDCDSFEAGGTWLSTHPPTLQRIEAIHALHGHRH